MEKGWVMEGRKEWGDTPKVLYLDTGWHINSIETFHGLPPNTNIDVFIHTLNSLCYIQFYSLLVNPVNMKQ